MLIRSLNSPELRECRESCPWFNRNGGMDRTLASQVFARSTARF